MKHNYFLRTFLFLLAFSTLLSCGSDDDNYTEIPDPAPISPVVLDPNAVPYAKLSDYKFYEGDLKNMEPAYKVIPYDLNSALFTDYAKKKRFIWMPEGAQATYDEDGKILNFPTGTVLIKNFYYDNVQPANTRKIIETRLMIKKAEGWIFANYIWNDEQTEATYTDANGFVDISWLENGAPKSITYEIPHPNDCFTCHKTGSTAIPIGPKPQHLNKNFTYAEGVANQLSKWIEVGYLASVPNTIASTVDWTDTSKSLDLRARSYLDINCAHCHSDNGHCDYMSMRFAFSETANPVNLGVCVAPFESAEPFLVAGRSTERSAIYDRLTTNNESKRMPLIGRTIVHDEAVGMIEQWINSLEECH